jgi:glutamate racemase
MEPAVKPAVEKNGSKRVLVAATPLTLQEEKYQNLVSRVDYAHIVDGVALPELVEYAEDFVFDQQLIVHYLRYKFSALDLQQYGTIVLGCTHFPYYKKSFREVFPDGIDIIDGSMGTINYLKKILNEKGLASGKGRREVTFFSSGKKEERDSRYTKYLRLLNSII